MCFLVELRNKEAKSEHYWGDVAESQEHLLPTL